MSVCRRAFVLALVLGMTSGAAFAQRSKGPAVPVGPNDQQIAHIATTAGEIDVRAAQLALKTSKNKDVREFAALMVRDHKKVDQQLAALMRGLLMQTENNPTSKALQAQAKEDRARLMALKGAEFDKAYAENEIAYHKAVGATLEGTLIPSARAPELKAFLQDALPLFQAHQRHAEALAAKMN